MSRSVHPFVYCLSEWRLLILHPNKPATVNIPTQTPTGPKSSPPVFRLPVLSHSPLSSAALQKTEDEWEYTAALCPFKDLTYPPIRFLFVSLQDSYKGICIFLDNCSMVSVSATNTALFCWFLSLNLIQTSRY